MRPEFAVHMLNARGKDNAAYIAESFEALLGKLEAATDNYPSREMSIVRTKLEEASFFAKKAMAILPANQQ